MKIAVTGATGFVGEHLLRELVKRNHSVTAVCRRPQDLILSGVNSVRGDILEPETLNTAFTGKDVVFHLAGVVGYSKAQRQIMEDVNVQGTRNTIEAVKSQGVSRLIHMSSVVAVGANPKPIPLDEESKYTIQNLNLGYFETKRKAELLVLDEVHSGNIDAVILNPSTIYGPGDMKKGSRKVQLKVMKGKFPFYPPGGVNVISIHNVVEAMIQAIKKGKMGERYILSGENLYIRDLFAIIAEAAGQKAPHIPLPKLALLALGKIGDSLEKIGKKGPINSENAWASILFHWFNNHKAANELGLKPTDAKTTIEESVKWAKDNLKDE